jgi:hypothetical protein
LRPVNPVLVRRPSVAARFQQAGFRANYFDAVPFAGAK